jgi:hypothetical protein
MDPTGLHGLNRQLGMVYQSYVGMNMRGGIEGDFRTHNTVHNLLAPAGLGVDHTSRVFVTGQDSFEQVINETVNFPGTYFCALGRPGLYHAIAFVSGHNASPVEFYLMDPNLGLYKEVWSENFVTVNARFLYEEYSVRHDMIEISLFKCRNIS